MTPQERLFCHLYVRASTKDQRYKAFRDAFGEPDASNHSIAGRLRRMERRGDIQAELERQNIAAEREIEMIAEAEREMALDIALAKKREEKEAWLNRLRAQKKIAARLDNPDTRLSSAENNFLSDSMKIHGHLGADTVVNVQQTNVAEKAKQIRDEITERLTHLGDMTTPEEPNA